MVQKKIPVLQLFQGACLFLTEHNKTKKLLGTTFKSLVIVKEIYSFKNIFYHSFTKAMRTEKN